MRRVTTAVIALSTVALAALLVSPVAAQIPAAAPRARR
jgi:hypothetical protein